jgi:hypothetical protein
MQANDYAHDRLWKGMTCTFSVPSDLSIDNRFATSRTDKASDVNEHSYELKHVHRGWVLICRRRLIDGSKDGEYEVAKSKIRSTVDDAGWYRKEFNSTRVRNR